MKLWSGRFQSDTDPAMDSFNSSIAFDARLYKHDILGSIAHASMLGDQGIIPAADAAKIVAGLKELLKDIESGKVEFSQSAEDIHMNIETLLTERIGEAGKHVHTGRSRNDQIALDMRMYMLDGVKASKEGLTALLGALLKTAQEHVNTVMPGYTHLQKAQPITLAHHLMAYFEMFKRDVSRLDDCYERMSEMPLGAGALATSTYPLDRQNVAKRLGFARVTQNSLDSVSDRDYCIEFCAGASIIMMHLSRFCEELVLWSSDEFRFVSMDDAYATGSSIMPQKKNPDAAELIRGKTARVYGGLMTLLSMMKSLPLAYNKDMQEDKPATFDVLDTLLACLDIFTRMFKTLKFDASGMKLAAARGFTNATDAADYLVKKGVPFRSAHEIVGALVLHCIGAGKALEELTLDEFKHFSDAFGDDVYAALSLETCVGGRAITGGPAPATVQAHMDASRAWLKSLS